MEHKYSLAKKGKSVCPACKQKRFVLYVDVTGKPLHSAVGKCDRADNCGHHYTPRQYFQDNNISFDTKREYASRSIVRGCEKHAVPVMPDFIAPDVFKKSLQGYEGNKFVQYLRGVIGDEAAKEAVKQYFVGASKHWEGATVFWQIDGLERVHTGKIMQYDSETGKRVKEPESKISWVHTVLKLPNFHLSQCLFGEHLLKENNKPVAIVESEKTAIIASVYLPEKIWLACGGCEGLNIDKCQVLTGRTVTLYPDAGKFGKWSEKAKELRAFCSKVDVFDLIEKQASEAERENGFDLADYLVRHPLIGTPSIGTVTPSSILRKPEQPNVSELAKKETTEHAANPQKREIPFFEEAEVLPYHRRFKHYTEDWTQEINSLETYFAGRNLPKSIQLNAWTALNDVRLFLDNHFAEIKAHNGNTTYLPTLDRLRELKQLIDTL
jgi:hypothetical protein